MKFILIMVVMNLTNPNDPSVLMHVPFTTKTECEASIKELPAPPPHLRAAFFCVKEDDLLGIKNHG